MLDIIIDMCQYTHNVVLDVLRYTLWRETLAGENIGEFGEWLSICQIIPAKFSK